MTAKNKKAEQTDLPMDVKKTNLGKAAEKFLKICGKEKTIKEEKSEQAKRVLEEMRKVNKHSITIDGRLLKEKIIKESIQLEVKTT